MIYRSNLRAPDLRPHFRLCDPPRMIAGHDAPSDPDYESACLFVTDDEAALLYHIALRTQGTWLDIGARFGWSGAHIMAAGRPAVLFDPDQMIAARQDRLERNLDHWWDSVVAVAHKRSQVFRHAPYVGVHIDGCHDAPEPLNDAQWADELTRPHATAVIVLHDAMGKPVRDAAAWLMENGWRARFYWTPNGVICAWRGNFKPPDHVRDQAIDWRPHEAAVSADIDLWRCE